MRPEMILDVLHRDLACAIALAFVEVPGVSVNLNAITLHDSQMKPKGTQQNWLDDQDPLEALTREYLTAKQQVAQSSSTWRPGGNAWGSAGATKQREEGLKRSLAARKTAQQLLTERGVLAYARGKGYRIYEGQ